MPDTLTAGLERGMTAKQRKAIERTICLTHAIHGKGRVIGIVWAEDLSYQESLHGMAVHQDDYKLGAVQFVAASDYKTVRYLHRDRLVLSK